MSATTSRLFIHEVRASLPDDASEPAEPMLTQSEVSKRFNVSVKTIGRWRVRGLAGKKIVVGGRKQWAFPATKVEEFAASHDALVSRGSKFRHLSEEEREAVLEQARREAADDILPTEACRRIAARLGRSPEAIRLVIKTHDAANPESAIYPAPPAPLGNEERDHILDLFRKGMNMQTLVKEFQKGKTPTS